MAARWIYLSIYLYLSHILNTWVGWKQECLNKIEKAWWQIKDFVNRTLASFRPSILLFCTASRWRCCSRDHADRHMLTSRTSRTQYVVASLCTRLKSTKQTFPLKPKVIYTCIFWQIKWYFGGKWNIWLPACWKETPKQSRLKNSDHINTRLMHVLRSS